MPAKRVWLTWMGGGDARSEVAGLAQALSSSGLKVSGDGWVDDLDNLAWTALATTLSEPRNSDAWLIAGRQSEFQTRTNRYALSMLAATLNAHRADRFPIVCLGLDGHPTAEAMPTLTRSFRFVDGRATNWLAKVVAAVFTPTQDRPGEFRLDVIAAPLIGQWFSVSPAHGEWHGAMFGVSDPAQITHHGVGPAGQLPEKCILEYPTAGIRAQIGDAEYTAWSVRNHLTATDAYYVKVEGSARRIAFGGHPGDDRAEVFVLELS